MMDINELANKVGGEIVGGRLVALVDGKKAYLSAIGDDGKPFLNELGLRLSNELSLAESVKTEPEPKAEPAPKRTRRKPEPEQIELDLEV